MQVSALGVQSLEFLRFWISGRVLWGLGLHLSRARWGSWELWAVGSDTGDGLGPSFHSHSLRNGPCRSIHTWRDERERRVFPPITAKILKQLAAVRSADSIPPSRINVGLVAHRTCLDSRSGCELVRSHSIPSSICSVAACPASRHHVGRVQMRCWSMMSDLPAQLRHPDLWSRRVNRVVQTMFIVAQR